MLKEPLQCRGQVVVDLSISGWHQPSLDVASRPLAISVLAGGRRDMSRRKLKRIAAV